MKSIFAITILLPIVLAQTGTTWFSCDVRGTGPLEFRETPRVASPIIGYFAPSTRLMLACYSVTEPGGCGDSNVWYKEAYHNVYIPSNCVQNCTGGTSAGMKSC
ncbi:hypothetical protein TWF694_000918 [Orbilia ellipsospora]|uniref:WSC domain-containing protein n=1 Tax=Orbilia ellipsospora TaxID=2528407 RepID=A0AAV9XQW0_9PEZI